MTLDMRNANKGYQGTEITIDSMQLKYAQIILSTLSAKHQES